MSKGSARADPVQSKLHSLVVQKRLYYINVSLDLNLQIGCDSPGSKCQSES
jgi:hypothetical protein